MKIETLKAGRDEKRDDCHVDNGSAEPELNVPSHKLDRVNDSPKEMSKDGLSAGSFTHETKTNWTHECQIPATSCEDVATKPEASGSTKQEKVLNVDKLANIVYQEHGGCLKKPRGKRKRKDCSRSINEVSVRESDFSADVCKESSLSYCGEIVKSSGVNEENANLKTAGIKDLMELLDSFLVVQGASVFTYKHDNQKQGRYEKLIRQHVDFDTIKSRIHNGTIKSVVELLRDLLLLSNNALVFYSKNTREHKTGLQLRDLVIKTLTEKLESSSTSPVGDPSVNVISTRSSTSYLRDSSARVRSMPSTSPVRDSSVKVRSMRPGNRKIVAKVAGGSSSAERVLVGAKKANKVDTIPAERVSAAVKKANKVDSPPSVESLSIKKACGGRTRTVGHESAVKRNATPRNDRKRIAK
ncbi:uncharacterized protein LOC114374396 isoform X2 [Glycine soja]|nr:uncharacterized protein LOC114374396 isoform X2 [Glycine soja]RZB81684.1 hypothetical protein D0Y65_031095 [Glycine soja]